jgi:hypothetical protein
VYPCIAMSRWLHMFGLWRVKRDSIRIATRVWLSGYRLRPLHTCRGRCNNDLGDTLCQGKPTVHPTAEFYRSCLRVLSHFCEPRCKTQRRMQYRTFLVDLLSGDHVLRRLLNGTAGIPGRRTRWKTRIEGLQSEILRECNTSR